MRFVTTNVRLGAEVYQRLRLKAVHERKSLAQLIHDAVDVVYGEPRAVRSSRTSLKRDPFFKLIGICKTKISDGAAHHDRDIYGVDL